MSKVYDFFTFYNELDLLEIRLEELYDVVDFFVILEGEKTFQNNVKPLFYRENKQRYEKFEDKIIHLVLPKENFVDDTWINESRQFNLSHKIIDTLNDDDIIFMSSLDEIPKREKIQECKEFLKYKNVVLQQDFFYLFVNTLFSADIYSENGTKWNGTKAIIKKRLTTDIESFYKNPYDYKIVLDSGWHFSFLGDSSFIYDKIHAYAHKEFNCISNSMLEKRASLLLDPLGRNEVRFISIYPMEKLPTCLSEKDKYKKYIYIM